MGLQVRKAFTADVELGHTLVVADYGQLELRLLAHMAGCKSMLEAFRLGGDFHSRTALNMYDHIKSAVANGVAQVHRQRVQVLFLALTPTVTFTVYGGRRLPAELGLQARAQPAAAGPSACLPSTIPQPFCATCLLAEVGARTGGRAVVLRVLLVYVCPTLNLSHCAPGACLLEWDGGPGGGQPPPVPLLKDMFGSERRKAKVLNFSIAYGKTAHGLARDWGTSLAEAEETVERWYSDRPEVRPARAQTAEPETAMHA